MSSQSVCLQAMFSWVQIRFVVRWFVVGVMILEMFGLEVVYICMLGKGGAERVDFQAQEARKRDTERILINKVYLRFLLQ
jgi:hypothetical protein